MLYKKEPFALAGGSFFALNLVLFPPRQTLYLGAENSSKKVCKNRKKVLTNLLRCGIIATPRKNSGKKCGLTHRKYGRFRDSEMTIVQIGKGIFDRLGR